MYLVQILEPADQTNPFKDSVRSFLSQMVAKANELGVVLDQDPSCKSLPESHFELVLREDFFNYMEKAKQEGVAKVSQVHFVTVKEPGSEEAPRLAVFMHPQVSQSVYSFKVETSERKPNSMKSPIEMPRPKGVVQVPSLWKKESPLLVPCEILQGAKILALDAEIKKAIHMPPKDPEEHDAGPLPFMDYCESFDDFENMGLATVGTYDFSQCREHIFWDDTYTHLQEQINQAELIVGFNNIPFDTHLLAANGIVIPFEKQYDLLLDLWTSQGFGMDYNSKTHRGFNLNAMVSANSDGLLGKNDNGALAPFYFQTGKNGLLSRYQMGDTYITAYLFNKAVENGGRLQHPKTKEWIELIDLKTILSN